jgi:hypothetical protein
MLLLMHPRPLVLEIAQENDKLLVLIRLVYQAVIHGLDILPPVAGTSVRTPAVGDLPLP